MNRKIKDLMFVAVAVAILGTAAFAFGSSTQPFPQNAPHVPSVSQQDGGGNGNGGGTTGGNPGIAA
jgi:hypothetical protein